MMRYSLRLAAAGLCIMLPLAGCSTPGTHAPHAPVQEGAILRGGEPVASQTPQGSSVIVAPYRGPLPPGMRPLPRAEAAPFPETVRPPSSPAVITLLEGANQKTHSGKFDTAAATLERALRLEPRNPEIWQRLAALRLKQKQFAQAANLAAKSSSFAGNDKSLIARNWQIIAQARQGLGDGKGAREASAKAQDATLH